MHVVGTHNKQNLLLCHQMPPKCLCCRYEITDLDSLQTLMSHDRQMALELQAAEHEGLLSACLAWITHVQQEEGGYNRTVRITASHWWGLDGQKLAWESQTIQDCSHYPRDIFANLQVRSTERAGMSFITVTCCNAKYSAEHLRSHFCVSHIGLLHNCVCSCCYRLVSECCCIP